MPSPEAALQREILRKIKDSRWSIKRYFKNLFKQLMPTELLNNPRITVVDELLIEGTLPAVIDKNYEKDGYVILFYAHKTHSSIVSPFNHDTNASHTSLLVCKVEHRTIHGVLNVDGYNNINYIDIVGERPGATRNPLIPNRMIIDAPDVGSEQCLPLQSISWDNLNCPIYAFAFANAIIRAFDVMPKLLDDLFIGSTVSQRGVETLKDVILQGIVGKYTKRIGASIYRDADAGMKYNAEVREMLAHSILGS